LHALELTGLKICFGSSLLNLIVSEARTMNGTISRSGCQRFFFSFGNRPALPYWQRWDGFSWPSAFVPEEQVSPRATRGDPVPLPCHPLGQLGHRVSPVLAKAGPVPHMEPLLFSCCLLRGRAFFVGTMVCNACR